MTITFETENDVVVYVLEKVISFARNNQNIFLAQSIWWISSLLGLQQDLIVHIDNLRIRENTGKPELEINSAPPGVHPDRVANFQVSEDSYEPSDQDSVSTAETDIHNEVIDNCEKFLRQSQLDRKAIGRKNRQASRVIKLRTKKNKQKLKTFRTQTEGINGGELRRRKAAGECQRCAWPQDRKGSHKTLDCFRWKRIEKGTAPFPPKQNYKR
jgi:hypothetical protein